MGGGGFDDPEKDPSLFPESRVRPWVVDDVEDSQLQGMVDNLERTLTFVSPAKEGPGVSCLDRTLPDDKGGVMFFREMARLKSEKKAAEARATSASCVLRPIGKVFEDLFRETHGLPPHKQHRACPNENLAETLVDHGEDLVTMEKSEQKRLDHVEEDNDNEEGLATDPDVARLLAALKQELDIDDSGVADSQIGSQKETDDDEIDRYCENNEREVGNDGLGDGEGDDGVGRTEEPEGDNNAKAPILTAEIGHHKVEEGKDGVGREEGMEDKDEPNRRERNVEIPLPCMQRQGQQQGRIDISRMKIDGSEHAGGAGMAAGPRPRSAPPSYCVSAGGFSKLSRKSSSHLARTVNHKLLQAAKEKEVGEQSSEANKESGAAQAGSAITQQTGVGIATVRQNAEALQANISVKRTSYLRGCRPRAARWFPRDNNVWYPPPHRGEGGVSGKGGGGGGERGESGVPALKYERQRPRTATAPRRREATLRKTIGSSKSTPLLTHPEAAFVFGVSAACKNDESVSRRPPSDRRTTLGKMLSRTASVADAISPRQGFDSPGRFAKSSVGNNRADSPYGGGSDNMGGAVVGRRRTETRTRPSTAGSAGRLRGRPCATNGTRLGLSSPSPSSSKIVAEGRKRNLESRRTPQRRVTGEGQREVVPSAKRKGTILAASSSSRNHSVGGGGVTTPVAAESTEMGVGRGGGAKVLFSPRWDGDPEMDVHQALEMTLNAAGGSVTPRGQFVNARKIIEDMKQVNTKDSTGDLLVTTQFKGSSAQA